MAGVRDEFWVRDRVDIDYWLYRRRGAGCRYDWLLEVRRLPPRYLAASC